MLNCILVMMLDKTDYDVIIGCSKYDNGTKLNSDRSAFELNKKKKAVFAG